MELPALMQFYPGLKPWDLERLTFAEVAELRRQMHKAYREAQKG